MRFKIGDVVELVSVDLAEKAVNIGYVGTVLLIENVLGKGECFKFQDGEWARSVNCRLRRPPSWDSWLYDTIKIDIEDKV